MSERTNETDQRHQPKQQRSIETRNAILDAATDLFAEQGYEQTTTHQISKAAGVSVGALYRYFPDKQAILEEVYQREISGLHARILKEFSLADIISKDVPDLVEKALSQAFKVYSEKPGLRTVLNEQSRKIPKLLHIRRAQEDVVHLAVRQILSAAPTVRLPDTEVGAYLVSLFMEALIDDFVLHKRGTNDFDEQRIIKGAIDFIQRYVMGRI